MEEEVDRGADADGRTPPQPPPSSSSPPRPSPSPAAAGSKAKNLRDRVSFSSSASRTHPSCWGRIRIRRIGSRSRGSTGAGEHDTAPAVRKIPSRVCGAGDRARCGCGGKADAAAVGGARTLLQRNDFYCDDCNTHR